MAREGGEGLEEVVAKLDYLVGFEIPAHDDITLTQTATEDIWTYKDGIATVAVVTVTYTDGTKATIDNVNKV